MKNFLSHLFKGSKEDEKESEFDKFVGKDEIVNKVVQELQSTKELQGYKWIKSRNTFELKTNFGYKRIVLETRSSIELESDKDCVTIKPSCFLRHNFLHQWFEEFSFKSKSDQKSTWTVGRSLSMLNKNPVEFNFIRNFENFNPSLQKLISGIKLLLNSIEIYSDPKAVYDNQIRKMVLDSNYQFPKQGSEWAFEALILTHVFEPEYYSSFKKRILEQLRILDQENEPNVREYYSNIQAIVQGLEEVTITNIK